MRYGEVLEEIETKAKLWNPETLEWEVATTSVESTDPTSGYKISDIDDAGNPSYYGYVNSGGNWYIMEINSVNKTYRYASGAANYTTNWTGRAGLSYGYFYEAF